MLLQKYMNIECGIHVKIKTCIILMCLFILRNTILSQEEIKFNKNDFTQGPSGSKEYWRNIRTAESNYEKGKGYYMKALLYYKKVYKAFPNHALLNYKMGACYLFSQNNKSKSLKYLVNAIKINPGIASDIHYLLGLSLQYNYKFTEAELRFHEYNSNYGEKRQKVPVDIVNKHIMECRSGQEIRKRSQRAMIENIGPNINTAEMEYHPLITNDEKILVFTRNSKKSKANKGGTDSLFVGEKIFITFNTNGDWQRPKPIGKKLNSLNNQVAVGMNSDGEALYIYDTNFEGDIAKSKWRRGKWTQPRLLGKYINSKYTETAISYSEDERMVFFISNRKDMTIGGKDIFLCTREAKRKRWGKPQNIGKKINTKYDEEGVYFDSKTKTLYFSSRGHNSIGGFDIFRTKYDAESGWSDPENLGIPINTPYDDIFISIPGGSKAAYISSSREGGYGNMDIYKVFFLTPEMPVKQATEKLLTDNAPHEDLFFLLQDEIKEIISINNFYKGSVVNGKYYTPLSAQVKIYEKTSDSLVYTVFSDSINGSFQIILNDTIMYSMVIDVAGFFPLTKEIYLCDISEEVNAEKNIIELMPVERGFTWYIHCLKPNRKSSGCNFDEKNIVFLEKILKQNQRLHIKLTGFSNASRSIRNNYSLAKQKATIIKNILVSRGVSKERLKVAGSIFRLPSDDTKKLSDNTEMNGVEIKVLKD